MFEGVCSQGSQRFACPYGTLRRNNIRSRIHKILLPKKHQTAHNLLAQFRFQNQVMLCQHVDELLWEVLRYIWVAVGHMRNKVDQFPQRNDSSIGGGRGCCHENLAMTLILIVLGAEILDVGPGKSANVSYGTQDRIQFMRATYLGSRRTLCCRLGLESRC